MCGILGIVLSENAQDSTSIAPMAVDCLTALQHRGTESSGLVGTNGCFNDHFEIVKGHGLVRDVYSNESIGALKDSIAVVGHNRYSTAGMKNAINCVQPFVLYTAAGLIAVAHNGELVNAHRSRDKILRSGVGLSTDTDSELIGQIISKTIAQNIKCRGENYEISGDISKELAATMSAIELSYSLVVMTYDRIYAIRDPYGNRPLSIGQIFSTKKQKNGNVNSPLSFIVASETCAFPAGTKFHSEVEAGELIEISKTGVKSIWQMVPKPKAFCIFEYVYFARADSMFEGQQVHGVREECGKILAIESPIEVDIVSTVPDSATAATLGYSLQSKVPYEPVLYRNVYVGRSFIQPNNEMRQTAVTRKFGVLKDNVVDKRIVLIDDSIVRGNTMRIIVHLRIASPPLRYPCYMGINIASKNELIASNLDENEIAESLGADSVKYLTLEGLEKAVQKNAKLPTESIGHCVACLNGKYPISIDF
uniref:Amidophosphoribosyltransferase n=1 Tax=Panagrolaimus superbus TaxID=310955 RepID=A0A914YMR2_9BILA